MAGYGPIGYTPPANPYSAMPIEPNSFHGLSPLPAQAAATQAMAPLQAKIDQSEAYDTQATQAAKFQQLLQSGQQGMQAYIQDVGKTHPELAAQFNHEFQTAAPWMQNLKGKDLTDMAFNMYDSWNGRLGGAKMSSYMNQNPDASMTDLLGQAGSNVGVKDQLTLKGNDQLRQSTIAKDKAIIQEKENKPGLQLQLQGMKDDSRIRAARIRATKDKSGASQMQYTYNDAKASFDELTKQIDTMTEQIRKDPIMAGLDKTTTMMMGLRRERAGWQKAMQHATQKGAKPDEYVTKPPEINLGQLPDAGTDATDGTPAAAPGAAPAASAAKPSSKAPDSVLVPFLQASYPSVTWSPEKIKTARDMLAKDEAAKGFR